MKTDWIFIDIIGKGGNGTVFRVENLKGESYALKELRNVKDSKYYQRFRDEVEILVKLKDKEGIIKIIDSYLPQKPSVDDKPFYVMPICKPIWDFFKGKRHDFIFKTYIDICKAVKLLHDNDITHRDIKPANILVQNSKAVLSDFGLVDFPNKQHVSDTNEQIGPKWTIAPEMQRISSTAEFKKADIYSLAKTLWILITNNIWCFEGQYIPNSSISLDKYIDLKIHQMTMMGDWNYFSIVLLERLLIDSTSNDVEKRPDIDTFIDRLEEWFLNNEKWLLRNPIEWNDAVSKIFPISIPSHCEWNSIIEIHGVLSILTKYNNLNHVFLPTHGGIDMFEIDFEIGSNCLIINKYIVFSPHRLTFECLGDTDWSYFRLEINELESLTDNPDVDYMSLAQDGGYSDYSEDGNRISRFKKGSFVFVYKRAPLNLLKGKSDAYTGIHNKMTEIEYRNYLEILKEKSAC